MDELLKRADTLLLDIAAVSEQVTRLNAQAEAEMADIRSRYNGPVKCLTEKIKLLEKVLVKLMKKNTAEIFDGDDQVDLKNGILLHGKEDKVTIPNDAKEKIEAKGWEEALNRTVTVIREVVEKWPVERLVVIGAKKKTVEVFSYELKNIIHHRDTEITEEKL